MKAGIHPDYELQTIHCGGCGTEWETRTTMKPNHSDGRIHIEVCSSCHPFYTGKQKLIDRAGRVERFRRKYGKKSEEQPAKSDEQPAKSDEQGATAGS